MTLRLRKKVLPAVAGAAALVAGTLGMLAAPAQAAEGDTTVRGITIPAFYNPPAELPNKNGTLIRSESMPLAVTLPSPQGKLPGKATRVMFKTTDAVNQPVAVTGAYIEPTKKWKGKGPRPLVVVAAGTQGQGDQCAPSIGLQNPIQLSLSGETMSFGYEVLAVYRLLNEGMAVMLSDYVGLGTTDRVHAYVNRLDQAQTINDAARAALNLSGTSLTNKSTVSFYGYSQGGGAAGAAAELQPKYAPELNLAGAYVGAPPADLIKTIDGIEGGALAVALAWTINGMVTYAPNLAPLLDEYLNDKGKDVLTDSATRCIGDGLIKHAFTKTSSLTKNGETLAQIVQKEPEIKALVEHQRIGTLKPKAPVRVVTGLADTTVPHEQARQLAVDWCKARSNVTYEPIFLPGIGGPLALVDHMTPLLLDQGKAINWLKDRANGKRVSSNCIWMPLLP